MGKKVKVTTKCGETFTYDYDQEVATVEIIKEPKPLELQAQLNAALEAVDYLCSGIACGVCAFYYEGGCAADDASDILKKAIGVKRVRGLEPTAKKVEE